MKTLIPRNFLNRIALICSVFLSACSDAYLDQKPSTDIVAPQSLEDFQLMLDFFRLNSTAALPQLSSDEFTIEKEQDWLALTPIERNAYVWNKDIYNGELEIGDWNYSYESVFYANSVIEGLQKIDQSLFSPSEYNNILGQAYFVRAFAFFDLIKTFAPPYGETDASRQLGIPLKLSANVDELTPRASLSETYGQIMSDLGKAMALLPPAVTVLRNRANKPAAYALTARVYLSMRDYRLAEVYADSCLALHRKLIDYNTISTGSTTPFEIDNDESMFFARYGVNYSVALYASISNMSVNKELYKLYDDNDLRKHIFFSAPDNKGLIKTKRAYAGRGRYPFSGLATDEVHLIKAECAARRGDLPVAMEFLNELLAHRYRRGTFEPYVLNRQEDALALILLERRKELVWRAGLRWDDIRRLNMEGANIVLTRSFGEKTYTLPANSSLYTFPIPDDEIALSGIEQNVR